MYTYLQHIEHAMNNYNSVKFIYHELERGLTRIVQVSLNCGWALRFALLRTSICPSVRPTGNLVCTTPPTLLDGFFSYSHTVTNMTWRWILRCCKFYMSYGTLSCLFSLLYSIQGIFFTWISIVLVRIFFACKLFILRQLHVKVNKVQDQ